MTESRDKLSGLFNQISTFTNDGEGGISKADVSQFVQSGFDSRHQTPVAALISRSFAGFDTNKDGRLSFDELPSAKFQDGSRIGQQLFNLTA